MSNTAQLAAEIESAKIAMKKHSVTMDAVITESRLSRNPRKTFFGFRFQNGMTVGTEIENADGSLSIVRAIVSCD